MKREEIQIILYTLIEGESVKLKVNSKAEEARIRDHVRRSEKYGYKFCLQYLHDGIFYLEKLKDGNRNKYQKIMNRGNGKTGV